MQLATSWLISTAHCIIIRGTHLQFRPGCGKLKGYARVRQLLCQQHHPLIDQRLARRCLCVLPRPSTARRCWAGSCVIVQRTPYRPPAGGAARWQQSMVHVS